MTPESNNNGYEMSEVKNETHGNISEENKRFSVENLADTIQRSIEKDGNISNLLDKYPKTLTKNNPLLFRDLKNNEIAVKDSMIKGEYPTFKLENGIFVCVNYRNINDMSMKEFENYVKNIKNNGEVFNGKEELKFQNTKIKNDLKLNNLDISDNGDILINGNKIKTEGGVAGLDGEPGIVQFKEFGNNVQMIFKNDIGGFLKSETSYIISTKTYTIIDEFTSTTK